MKTFSFRLSLLLFLLSFILFVTTYLMINISGGDDALIYDRHDEVERRTCSVLEKNEEEEKEQQQHKDLLIGYKILYHTLEKESQLKYLHLLREATFRRSEEELTGIMKTIYGTSKKRTNELEKLWKFPHEPIIQIKDTPKSQIGDSIQSDVERTSTMEMISLSLPSRSTKLNKQLWSTWDIRFILIQAQATRMVSAVATSIRKFEPNEERKKWLTELAEEYEMIRENLINYLQ